MMMTMMMMIKCLTFTQTYSVSEPVIEDIDLQFFMHWDVDYDLQLIVFNRL